MYPIARTLSILLESAQGLVFRRRGKDPMRGREVTRRGAPDHGTTAAAASSSVQHRRSRDPDAALRTIADALPIGLVVTDSAGVCLHTNPVYRAMSGLTLPQATGTHWSEPIHPEDRDEVLRCWRDRPPDLDVFVSESRLQAADGRIVWSRREIVGLQDGGHVHTLHDIGADKAAEQARKSAERLLIEEKTRAEVTLECIGDAVVTTDRGGRVTYLNKVAEVMTGWSRARALGQPLNKVLPIIDAATRQPAINPALLAMKEGRAIALQANCVLVRPDGTEAGIEDSAAPVYAVDGGLIGAVLVFRDEKLSEASTARMAYLAHHDALTGLPNRLLLAERMDHTLRAACRRGTKMALMFIDMDNFKRINDTLGHEIGDLLICRLAEILLGSVRQTDTVCRYGGDEFVVMLEEIKEAEDVARVMAGLRKTTADPIVINGHAIRLTVSIGVSVYPDHGEDAGTLLRHADRRMYRAKANLARDPPQMQALDAIARPDELRAEPVAGRPAGASPKVTAR